MTFSEIGYIAALMAGLFILICFIAGGYLSFYLSSLRPVNALKFKSPGHSKRRGGRILVVLQFIITTAILSSVIIMQLQLNYIKTKPLGFDKEHIVILPLTGEAVQDKAMLLKDQLSGLAAVSSVSALSEIP